jgi:threonine dehydratase
VTLQTPAFVDVLAAKRRIAPYLRPTPLYNHPALSELVGTEVWVKHENHQPVGAFKVRGGVNLVSQLDEDERRRSVITASTGNHGQSIAYAARLFGVRAIVCVPEGANPVKLASMRSLGAELVVHGRDFDDARENCERLAAEHGYRYVHSGNEPLLIAGVATEAIRPAIEVIGVQAEAAPAAYRSWKARQLLEDRMETRAEGLATRVAFELPQQILQEHLDDFVLVGEDELDQAVVRMIEGTRNLVEPAGAAPLAAALRLRDRLTGRRVALVLSGGNISPDQLREILLAR